MALEVGSTLGHYQVTALIGEGGMGQVYRATDTQLNRDVALKVLPDAVADDPDRLARFQREAQVLASLNHPGIAQIYGTEKSENTQALVLELVEGPTLADRIAQGPIPVDEAVPIAKRIAGALEAAHDAGVIHRDLKPANIKVRNDGTVKVLDFGLAKAIVGEGSSGDLTQTPTITAMATATGVLLGTAPYMSPEQAKGRPVDRRTDIWAFGCIVYELLTGQRAFPGDDIADSLVAVLTADVAYAALPHETPKGLHRLIRRCLERDPKRRLRDIADGMVELDDGLEPTADAIGASVGVPTPMTPRMPSGAWVIAVVLAIVAGIAGWTVRPPPPPSRDALSVVLPPEIPLRDTSRSVAAISPDGRHLVYVGQRDGTSQLYHRPLDQLDAVPIPGTEGADDPFFSPDGESVAFLAMFGGERSVRRVRLSGGSVNTVCDIPSEMTRVVANLAGWSDDDMIWMGGHGPGLYRVQASGGVPQRMTTIDPAAGVTMHIYPHPLPGGGAVLYEERRASGQRTIKVYVPNTGEHRPLLEGWRASYTESGHIVFFDHDTDRQADVGTLWAIPFDLDRLEITGEPLRVFEGIRLTREGIAQAYVGRDGTLVYVPGALPDDRTLVWVDREGHEEALNAPARRYRSPRVSPDGNRIAVHIEQGSAGDIHVYDLARGSLTRVTTDPSVDDSPMWALAGDQILFHSDRGEPLGEGIYRKAADGTGAAEHVYSHPNARVTPMSWHPDGDGFLTGEQTLVGTTGLDIGRLTVIGEPSWEPFENTDIAEWAPAISSDGQWVALNASQPHIGVYVRPYHHDAAIIPVTSGAPSFAWHAIWSPDGTELFYRDRGGPGAVAAVSMTVEQGVITTGTAELLFDDTYFFRQFGARDWDIAPDGRFLMIKEAVPGVPGRQINILRNWVDRLNERAPVQ